MSPKIAENLKYTFRTYKQCLKFQNLILLKLRRRRHGKGKSPVKPPPQGQKNHPWATSHPKPPAKSKWWEELNFILFFMVQNVSLLTRTTYLFMLHWKWIWTVAAYKPACICYFDPWDNKLTFFCSLQTPTPANN